MDIFPLIDFFVLEDSGLGFVVLIALPTGARVPQGAE